MSTFGVCVEQLHNGEEVLNDQCIEIENGIIKSICEQKGTESNLLKGTLTAGFIDVQVNGGGGLLFNQSPTAATLKVIAKAHQQFGTTGWMATLITDSLPKMQQAADAVAEAILDPENGILGIHFEGPFLSTHKKGIHSEPFIRPFSAAEEAIFNRTDIGKVLLTVAPEAITSEQISRLVSNGIIVSIGHSNSSFEQTNQAIAAGATGFTHLFNAMSQFNSREPGVVGAALQAKGCYSGIILDGYHLHPASAAIAYHSETELMLVTDAMATVATELQQFEYFSEIIYKKEGCLRDKNNHLAGSTLDMQTAVINAQQMLNISAAESYNLASINPAKFLGVDSNYGNLVVGKKANMVLIDENQQVRQSWINGALVVS
jgi:N-acetylglucosamine-6-phosphate deacetylase